MFTICFFCILMEEIIILIKTVVVDYKMYYNIQLIVSISVKILQQYLLCSFHLIIFMSYKCI